jgi:hypothetical protein
MKLLIKLSVFVLFISLSSFSQIDNVQFTDMEGNSYDLYQLLESGKHVLCHFTFNT